MCKDCGRVVPTNEMAAYGECEDCWVSRFALFRKSALNDPSRLSSAGKHQLIDGKMEPIEYEVMSTRGD
jgi:hypothetical protein